MSTAEPTGMTALRTPHRWRRWGLRALLLVVLGLVAGELVLRFAFGLGDPPLYELDNDVEYMLVPSRTYHRFGNTYSVNSFSMRSPEFPPSRTNPQELRVLVIGDSIVNGGGMVDQRDLATELLKSKLSAELQRPVIVGNISAGSWGPPNQLAYIRIYGTFDADVVLHVLNSMDIDDVPGNEGIGPQWPQRSPVLALQEAFANYGVRFLERVTKQRFTPAPAHTPNHEQDKATCLQAVRELANAVRAGGGTYVMVSYLTRDELNGSPQPGAACFAGLAQELGVLRLDTGPAFQSAISAGNDPFLPGDKVHAGKQGQRLLAEVLAEGVRKALAQRVIAPEKSDHPAAGEGPKSPGK